jgi:hypothetical protein
MHYDRLITTGNLGGPHSMIVENGSPCLVGGCEETATAAGMCNMHYKRHRKTGSAGSYTRLRARVGSGLDRKGYRVLYIEGKQHKEHRLVMERVLGRSMRKDENCHHLDGNRANNDPANLELWVKSQPCGQRVTDKLKAALKLIRMYPELLSLEGFRLIALESQEATDLFRDDTSNTYSGTAPAVL